MPQGDSYERLSGVIAAMGRLERVFHGVIASSSKLKENIDKSDEMFGTSNRLKNELTSAVTSPVLFKKLGEVLEKKLGGKNTPIIRQNLAKAAALRKQYLASQKAQRKIGVQIATAQAKRPHTRSAQALTALNQKIASLQAQHGTAGMNAFKQRWAMKAALTRAQKSALSKGSGVGTLSKLGMLSKAAGFAGVAFSASVQVIKMWDEKLKESALIIDKYSRFSVGGMHASSLMFIRDIQRNVQSSRALGGSMLEFARASSDMKDSWKNVNIVLDRFTLSLGTVGSKLGNAVGNMVAPVAKGFDVMMGKFAKMTLAQATAASIIGGPLVGSLIGLAKAAKWKTEDEELQAVKDRISRRRQAIVHGHMNILQPGDMGKFEMDMLGIRPDPKKGFDRFQMPKNWVKPGGGGNNQNPGMPGNVMGGMAMGAGGMQMPQNQGMAFNPALDKVNLNLALVEKKISIIEKTEAGLDQAIAQRQTNIMKLEHGGITQDEQIKINKKQSEVDQYMEKMRNLQLEERDLRQQRSDLKDKREGLMNKQAIGWVNPWNAPGPMGRKQAGADLMEVRIA